MPQACAEGTPQTCAEDTPQTCAEGAMCIQITSQVCTRLAPVSTKAMFMLNMFGGKCFSVLFGKGTVEPSLFWGEHTLQWPQAVEEAVSCRQANNTAGPSLP